MYNVFLRHIEASSKVTTQPLGASCVSIPDRARPRDEPQNLRGPSLPREDSPNSICGADNKARNAWFISEGFRLERELFHGLFLLDNKAESGGILVDDFLKLLTEGRLKGVARLGTEDEKHDVGWFF